MRIARRIDAATCKAKNFALQNTSARNHNTRNGDANSRVAPHFPSWRGRGPKEFAMRLRGYSGYSDVSWSMRVLRAVPVIAGAALIGGVVGGFAVFAINSAFTWEPPSQARPQARADQQPTAVEQTATRPVRAVGGAVPDPSAGMSEPPPAQQQPRCSAFAQPQISSQLLASKPLGPAAQLVKQLPPQTGIAAPSATQTQNQPAIQPTNQTPIPTQSATATVQQRWPDALSPAHQNASNATNAQQTAPQQQTTPPSAIDQSADSNPASPGDQNNPAGSRQSRHSRRHTIIGTNGFRNGGGNEAPIAASPRGQDARTQDARGYDRLYDSYGNRIDRRYGRDAGYRTRPRVILREQIEEPQPEPFWGGGYYRY
jgi:hypothetical protein